MTDVELSVDGNQLIAQLRYKGGFPIKNTPAPPSPPPFAIALYEQDHVFVPDGLMKGMRGEFLRGPDGEIAWLRVGGRIHARH
jgi:hypothetical protein